MPKRVLNNEYAISRANEAVAGRPHFDEIVGYLAPRVRDALVDDLIEYDRNGVVSPLIEEMLRRANCLADADRIAVNRDPATLAA